MAQLAVLAGLLLLAELQASDLADRSTLQGFLSKYRPSRSEASKSSASFYKFITPIFKRGKHGHGPDALSYHNNLAEHGPAKDAIHVQYPNVNRDHQETASQIMGSPVAVFDDKTILHPTMHVKDSMALTAAREEPSKSDKHFDLPRMAAWGEKQAAQKLLANDSSTAISLSVVGIGLLSLVTMLGVHLRRGLQADTIPANSGGLELDMPRSTALALGDNVMEMMSQDSSVDDSAAMLETRPPCKVNSGRVGWGQLSPQNSASQTVCHAAPPLSYAAPPRRPRAPPRSYRERREPPRRYFADHEFTRLRRRVWGEGASEKPFRAKCPLCNTNCNSVMQAFDHLLSAQHIDSLRDNYPDIMQGFVAPKTVMGMAVLLTEPAFYDLHEDLGFDVASLLEAAPSEERRRVAAKRFQEEISRMPPNFDWIQVQDRWAVRWNEIPDPAGNPSILEAPSIDEMLLRCDLDEVPPLVQIPDLPASLPRLDYRKLNGTEHSWPFEPTSRLGIAVAKKLGQSLGDYDIICGTALIRALAGDNVRAKDKFYLQRYQGTLCCLHVPWHFYGKADAGHAVESLLCGSDDMGSSFYTSTSMHIGPYRLLVTSSVDASDDAGELVEVKSSSTKQGMQMVDRITSLQIALNGSRYLLCCTVNESRTQVLETERILSSDAIKSRSATFTKQGQRVSLLLDRLVKHPCFDCETSEVMELSFDRIKDLVLTPAEEGITVLPKGML